MKGPKGPDGLRAVNVVTADHRGPRSACVQRTNEAPEPFKDASKGRLILRITADNLSTTRWETMSSDRVKRISRS